MEGMDTATPSPRNPARPELSLDDRYLREEGAVYLSGMQALVRLPIDQSRRDRRADLRIGTFISGYPGSPLGGYDLALRQARRILTEHDIRHVPGANEELAATALSGTQMLDRYPHSRYDGVVGLWYGKGPGVDRSGDALKHGNFAGTSRHGAVVVLSGEDHEAKSSTMPYQDDYAFVGHGMPILYPASTGEFLTLGLHAIALSRFSRLLGGDEARGAARRRRRDGRRVARRPPGSSIPELLIDGKPFRKSTDFTFFPGLNIETERQLYYERHRAVLAYARANGLDLRRDRRGAATAWAWSRRASRTPTSARRSSTSASTTSALRALGSAPAEGGADLPARRRRGARLRAGSRRDRGGRGEARLPRGAGEGGARRASARRPGLRQGRRDRRAAVPDPGGHGLRPGGGAARAPALRLAASQPDLAGRHPGPARRDPGDPRAAARGAPGPDAELLLRVPPQRRHAAPAGRGGVGQPRVPLVRLDHRAAASGTSSR